MKVLINDPEYYTVYDTETKQYILYSSLEDMLEDDVIGVFDGAEYQYLGDEDDPDDFEDDDDYYQEVNTVVAYKYTRDEIKLMQAVDEVILTDTYRDRSILSRNYIRLENILYVDPKHFTFQFFSCRELLTTSIFRLLDKYNSHYRWFEKGVDAIVADDGNALVIKWNKKLLNEVIARFKLTNHELEVGDFV